MLAFHGLGTEQENTATATEGASESTFFKALRSQRLLVLKKAIKLECAGFFAPQEEKTNSVPVRVYAT